MKQDPLGVTHADYDRGAPRRGSNRLRFEPRALNFTVREMLEATGNCIILLGTTFKIPFGIAIDVCTSCFTCHR